MNTSQPLPEENEIAPSETTAEPSQPRRKFRFAPAFWTTASILSLIVNIILIIIVVVLASNLFTLKKKIGRASCRERV